MYISERILLKGKPGTGKVDTLKDRTRYVVGSLISVIVIGFTFLAQAL